MSQAELSTLRTRATGDPVTCPRCGKPAERMGIVNFSDGKSPRRPEECYSCPHGCREVDATLQDLFGDETPYRLEFVLLGTGGREVKEIVSLGKDEFQ